ncbi:MAG: radical SAM protein [Candidatus Omnitrophota bacterium]
MDSIFKKKLKKVAKTLIVPFEKAFGGLLHDKRFLTLYMDLNNKCNLKCTMCHFNANLDNEPVVIMSLELFEKIAKEVFPKTRRLHLSCSAEPLIIPDFFKYLKIVSKYSIPHTKISTNGLLLTEGMSLAIIEANITQVGVSIDGATKETYEKVRKGSNFEKVIENIVLLQSLKRKLKKNKPLLTFSFTLMRSNIHELLQFVRLAKKLEADLIQVTHLIPFKSLDIMSESLVNYKKETNEILNEAESLAKSIKIALELPSRFSLNKAKDTQLLFNKPDCRVLYNSMYIISDGRVVPCTWFSLKEYCVGDFKKENFQEIWNGEVYGRLRRQWRNRTYPEYCRNCPVWGSESIDNYVFQEKERKDVLNISSVGV